MRPVSPRFLRTITGSHAAIFRARVLSPELAGQTGVNPDGTEVTLTGGDVKLDAGADIRSTAEVRLVAPWPETASSLLVPYGSELFLERGVAYGGGATEWVSLGYFRIDTVEQDDAPRGEIRVSAPDRMSKIVDAKMTDVAQFKAVQTYGAVVSALVAGADPGIVIEWDDSTAGNAIGRAILVEDDRYAALKDLVTSVGKVAYFDYRGVLVIRTPPDLADPVWIVSRGEGGVLLAAGRSLSREGVYNGVLAIGEALDTKPPARGLVVDTGVSSPTRWGGPFGRVPRTYSSPLLTTNSQAQLAARTVLSRSLGLPYNVDLTAVPNPALEPDDPIAVGIEGRPTATPPVILAADSFVRSFAPGWGYTERGDSWSSLFAGYAVGGNTGTLALDPDTASSQLNSTLRGRTDADATVDIRVNPGGGGVTGASLVSGIMLRNDGGTHYYNCRLEFNVSGTTTLKISRRTEAAGLVERASLASFNVFTPGQWWRVRARARGPLVQMKAWPRDEPEPRAWQLADTDPARSVVGVRFGLYFWRLGANTNVGPQWEVDTWRVQSAPDEALRGGELHVIDTLTIPLTADGAMSATTREQTLTVIEAGS